jgi:threonine/homoserine/homoserine lactone efflux protein
MVAVFYGVGRLMALSYVQAGIALLGGVLLLVMGVGMLRSIRQAEIETGQDARSPIVAGILLSIGNPYFLVWWATVGAALIMRSFRFGVLGFLAFGALHWLCDLTWNYFLSTL